MNKRIVGILLSVFLGALSGAAKDAPFSIGLVADVQYADTPARGGRTPREAPRRLQEAVDSFNAHKVDFAVSLGDFIDWDDIEYSTFLTTNQNLETVDWKHFNTIEAVWSKIDAPRYHVLGNHEWCVPDRAHDGEKPHRVYKKYGFEDKAYHDFSHKGFRFIVVDGTDLYMYAYPRDSYAYRAARQYYEKRKTGGPWDGAISPQQLDWIKKTLIDAAAKDEKVVVLCHFPIHEPTSHHNLINSVEVAELLDGFPNVVLWLNGHKHGGGYAIMNGQRHHLNLKGMQNFDDTHYRLEFFQDRIEVYRAEQTDPERVLDISGKLKVAPKSQGG